MAEVWYIEQQDGTVSGPLPEKSVCEGLLTGKITPDLRVRQGASGPWCLASRARELFQQLTENGWYIQSQEATFGPFTSDRLLQLHAAGEIASDAKLRQGPSGDWKEAAALFAMWTRPETSPETPPDEERGSAPQQAELKWQVEPIRHYLLPLERTDASIARQCFAYERLFLRPATNEGDDCLHVFRSNDQLVGAFSVANSRQLLANHQRGIRHIALFSSTATGCEVIVILCPAGTHSIDSRRYIDTHFKQAQHESV